MYLERKNIIQESKECQWDAYTERKKKLIIYHHKFQVKDVFQEARITSDVKW